MRPRPGPGRPTPTGGRRAQGDGCSSRSLRSGQDGGVEAASSEVERMRPGGIDGPDVTDAEAVTPLVDDPEPGASSGDGRATGGPGQDRPMVAGAVHGDQRARQAAACPVDDEVPAAEAHDDAKIRL